MPTVSCIAAMMLNGPNVELPSDYNQTLVNDSYQDGWLPTLLAVGNVTWNRTELLRVAVAPSEVIVLLGNSLNFFSPSTLVVH